ncbi:MAG: thiamine diphosphokinase [Desulfobacteraceae bacterium]|nr:MAG: thiamine diphosphokinase [Desulfobacteraceae bacterium]
MKSGTIILANGKFPDHQVPLICLDKAERVVCCDGAADSLVHYGRDPDAIVGDCDSLSPWIIKQFHDRIFRDGDQETNDLTKAVKWCIHKGYNDITILGATGKREDHTLGNIALLAVYSKAVKVMMVTDSGIFRPLNESADVESFNGQQVSLFSIDPETEITSTGLKYKLEKMKFKSWWNGTLNESTGNKFSLEFTGGPLIVFRKFGKMEFNL